MWSVIQHQRLRKQSAAEFNKKPSEKNVTQGSSKQKASEDTVEKRSLELKPSEKDNKQTAPEEAGQKRSLELQHSEKDNKQTAPEEGGQRRSLELQHSEKDDKIWVRIAGDDDPFDPRNWPLLERSKNIVILVLLVFVQAWAGAAESMANSTASKEQHHSKVAENLIVAMYLFGIGTGSIFAGPISESVGRNPVYLISTFCYLFFVFGAAMAPNLGGRIVCRYFIGLFASATLTINGGSVKDQFRSVKRAFVFPVIAWANVAAPMIAPIASGWIVEHTNLGWRWTEWMTLIISAPTYLPVLLDWKASGLRHATGDKRYVSKHAESKTFGERMRKAVTMPAKFFFTEPVITVLGIYLVFLYVLLFSFLSGFDYIFKETYNLSTAKTGSCFGAIAAGATAFTFGAPGFYSWARHRTEHIQGASVTPEFRLWPAIVAAPLLPVTLFWLGWGNYSSISIWCSLGACFVFGAVMIAIYVSSYEYIIDSYGDHAAMALSSITCCIAVILAPAPWVFWKFGKKLRKKSPYAVDPEEK
ncbi:hypothetical protein N0V88_007210 [Collariella sp. IMI 366227]|nr:hypothetical protein N0V88_007210 [Collariella sp. IMI 366227]